MASEYQETVEEEIPGTIFVFGVTDDEENENPPAIISHPDDYELPNHFVREKEAGGGVTTYALLKCLESMKATNGSRKKKLTWADALQTMHDEIENDGGRTSLPTLSSSRPIDVHKERIRMSGVAVRGVKRALLVGAHYEDEEDEDLWLASCHTDVRRIRHHLLHEEGFLKENILVMMDDDRHHEPTKNFVLDALERMCDISEYGDSIFFHFSGHGGTLRNEEEYDEEGIMHEVLAPGDYRDAGVLTDEELYASFVTRVPEGVFAMAVIDTCHPTPSQSGKSSAIDLPYVYNAGDEEIRHSEGYRPGRGLMAAAAGGAGLAAGAAALAANAKKKKKGKNQKYDEEEEDEIDPSYGDGSYEEEEKQKQKSTKKKSSKSKKKKQPEEEENEQELYDKAYDTESDDEEKMPSPKPKKKSKKKQTEEEKKEQELYDKAYDTESDEEEKALSPKPKKKSKKKKKKEGSSSRNEEDHSEEAGQEEEKPKKKKKKSKKK